MTPEFQHIQERIAKSEEVALAELYQYFYKRLKHFAKALIRSEEAAEEVVEDVFINLWKRRDKITEIENLTVYLYVAVKNKSLNRLSHKAKELLSAPFDFLNIELQDAVGNPYDLMITSEMMKLMQKAIDALPPRCKMIFKLVREDGLRYKEVAQILNISVNTIDVQMAIAVKRIAAAIHIEKFTKVYSSSREEKKS